MLKRLLILSLVFSFSLNLSACFWNNNDIPEIENDASTYNLNTENNTDEKDLDYYVDNDDFDDIAISGPYYISPSNPSQENDQIYTEALKEVINEAINLTAKNISLAKNFKNSLEDLKDKIIKTSSTIIETENADSAEMKENADLIISNEMNENLILTSLESIGNISENESSYAYLEYNRTALFFQLKEALAKDLLSLTIIADNLINNYSESNQKETEDLDKYLTKANKLFEEFTELDEKSQELALLLKRIDTAQYYAGLAANAYFDSQINEIENKINALNNNEYIDDEDIAFIAEYGHSLKNFNEQIKEELALIDESKLLAISLDNNDYSFIKTAQAAEEVRMIHAINALKDGKYKDGLKKMAQANWNTMKDMAKKTRDTVAGTVEMANTAAKSTFDYLWGKWEGNSNQEIDEQIENNIKIMKNNLQTGKAGVETLDNAEAYFDWAENTGGEFSEAAVEGLIGKGASSWLAGHLGKISVNMFTGFGKGVTKIFNPDSSGGEIAEGMLDVGLSFVGGSKVIAKGGQVMRGSKESFKLLGKKGVNYLEKLFASNHVKNLQKISANILKNKKLTKEEIKLLYNNAKRIAKNEFLQKEMAAISEKINKEFLDLMKEGGDTFIKNLKAGGGSYQEFMEKTFSNTLSGYKDALKTVLGEGFEDYIDNVVANKADDLIKTLVKDYIDKNLIPGLGGPFDGNYQGTLSNNDDFTIPVSATISENNITADINYSADFEGGMVTITGQNNGKLDLIEDSENEAIITGDGNIRINISGGEDALVINVNLNINGNIINDTIDLNLNGIISNMSGQFWGEDVSEYSGQEITPLYLTLYKQ